MSVRRNTTNRLRLIRTCHTCGRTFPTTAASPFMRQLTNVDGKKQKTCYFCSESCKAATYKHLFDGRAAERKKARDAARSTEKNRRYYAAHAEQMRARRRTQYWADPKASREDNQYYRQKRQLLVKGEPK